MNGERTVITVGQDRRAKDVNTGYEIKTIYRCRRIRNRHSGTYRTV